MITTVLVANRGEIARRVIRTCRDLGLSTVVVHSDADALAPAVSESDAAVRLPGDSPADTYLRGDLVIEAALRAGADAVHPGYGFLSENADFARAVRSAGLTWIGPPPEAIASMGSKIEAKKLMAAAGVPVLIELAPDSVGEADLPVLIKASAGGGGRGMRVVRHLADLPSELALAEAEAESAFGDGTVFCEPYLATGRHIEVQVMADEHGTVWAVGERECSIQRRHQKIVEEAPSPLVERTPGMREALFDASVAAARAIGYAGAGTVEFLADENGSFYFLEMNTRLQVEHPVTECTTGLDLVALQIQVADGLRLDGSAPSAAGHSIEVRIYAEDPAAGWQPQHGLLSTFDVPSADTEFGLLARPGIRLDSGVVDGSAVSIHYDPMLAKVISWAPTRTDAARRLSAGLRRARIHGVTTNRDLLVRILEHPGFGAGDTDTAFLDRHGLDGPDGLAAPLADADSIRICALAASLAVSACNRRDANVLTGLPAGWRNIRSQPLRRRFLVGGDEVEVAHVSDRNGLFVEGRDDVALVAASPDRVVLEVGGVTRSFATAVNVEDGRTHVYVDGPLGSVSLTVADRLPDPDDHTAPGSLLAAMPGSVVRVAAAVGEVVTAGQPILWLEAMKMQHEVQAPADGVVTELPVSEGDQVDVGAVLAVVTADTDEQHDLDEETK